MAHARGGSTTMACFHVIETDTATQEDEIPENKNDTATQLL